MDSTYIPIIISVIALVVSIGNLIWNIYKEGIKPKLKTVFVNRVLVSTGNPNPSAPFLVLEGTNMGNRNIICETPCVLLKKGVFKKQIASIFPDYEHFAASPINKRNIAPGEVFRFVFGYQDQPKNEKNLLNSLKNNELYKIGISDSYGQYHWASRKDIKRVRKALIKSGAI